MNPKPLLRVQANHVLHRSGEVGGVDFDVPLVIAVKELKNGARPRKGKR